MIRLNQISNNKSRGINMTTVSKINDKFYINIENTSTGDIQSIEVTELDPNNPKSLKLPENPSNRKYLSIERVEKAPNQTYELTPKEARKNGPVERAPKKPDRDYLDEDDQITYDYLMNKIREAKEAEKEAKRPKPLTEREKMIKRIEKLQKMLAEMPD